MHGSYAVVVSVVAEAFSPGDAVEAVAEFLSQQVRYLLPHGAVVEWRVSLDPAERGPGVVQSGADLRAAASGALVFETP